MFRSKSIAGANIACWVTTIAVVCLAFTVFFIFQKLNDFEKRAYALQEESLLHREDILKNEVSNIIKYLRFKEKNFNPSDSEASRKELISELKEIRFETFQGGKILILDSTGKVLLYRSDDFVEGSRITDLMGPNGAVSFSDLSNSSKLPSGGFSKYEKYNKDNKTPSLMLAYSKYYKKFNWIICSELDMTSLKKIYAFNKEKMKKSLFADIAYICLIGIVITLTAIAFFHLISKRLREETKQIISYLKHIENGEEAILNDDEFEYSELRYIAASAVEMVEKKAEYLARIKKLAVEAETRSHEKSNYLANMSHEIRMPLNGIMGMSNILLEDKLNEKQRDCVQSILSSGQTLEALVDDIRDFSAFETEEPAIKNEPFKLRDVCEGAVKLSSRKVSDKKLDLKLNLPDDIPEAFLGDAKRIKQILSILITNATVFTSEGGISVDLSLVESHEGKNEIEFKVTDSGLGISEEKLDLIFDFTHHGHLKSRKFAGVSLGLAVCKKLVKAMNGVIGAESEKGKGATFYFILPLDTFEGEVPKPAEEKTKTQTGSAILKPERKIKALLAEDDPVNQRVELNFLARFGCEIDLAPNGTAALERFKENSYDIIFMDCEMPELDGYEATAEIRKLEEGKDSKTPIIAMTANALHTDIEECKNAGMDDHIAKPVTLEKLSAIIEKYTN